MMADLFWPGDERAAAAFEQGAFLETMVEVELVWFHVLQGAGLAPKVADDALDGLVTKEDLAEIATKAEASGNPVVPLRGADARTARRTRTRPLPGGCTAGSPARTCSTLRWSSAPGPHTGWFSPISTARWRRSRSWPSDTATTSWPDGR